jgi:non-specific serine/threonine protein kinase
MDTIPKTRFTQLTKADLRNAATPAIYRQAEKLFDQGAVKIKNFDYSSVEASVKDQFYPYNVTIRETANGQLNAQCTCYLRYSPCQHTHAVLLAVLEEIQRLHAVPPKPPSWEDYLSDLPKLQERDALNRDVQTMKLLFFIELKPRKWQLHPAPTYIKKSGELGRRSRLQFDYDGELRGVEASAVEEKVIQTIKQRARAAEHSSYYYNSYGTSDQFEFDYGEEAGYIFDMLADSAVYLDASGPQPLPLRLVNAPAQLFFQLTNGVIGADGQPAYQFFPQIQFHDHPEKLDENYRILTSRPFWVLKNEKLLRLQESFPANYLMPFTRKGYELQIPQEQVGNFLQSFVPHLKHNLKLVLPENLSLQTVRELTGRRLYLSEKNETLRVELRLVYGEIEVAARSQQQSSLANTAADNGKLWRVERDYPAEAAVHDAMTAFGLKPDESWDFYAPIKEPLAWIFDELPKLAAAGFEIFGEEALKTYRVNRNQLNVKVAVSSDIDWFDLNMAIDFGGVMLSLANLKQAVRHQDKFVKLADGSLARLPEEWEKRFRHFFNFAEVDAEKGGAQIASAHAMLIDALFDGVHEKNFDDHFKKRVAKLRDFKGIAEIPAPKNLQGMLRPYQQAGLNWMGFLKDYGFNGCLADDMGLGKTIQTLAFLLREKSLNGQAAHGPEGKRGKNQATTSLIVAPLSVLFNWEKECAKFSPDLKLLIHHGLDREKSAAHFSEYDIILTSYATMRLDIEFLKDFAFHYIILDESQNIKNPISQTAKAATILQSRHRLVLTGTPVENNTAELWSQFSFLNPGMLGTLNYFQSQFSVPIERYSDDSAAALLKKMIAPFLLRRTKEEVVKELPPKSEQIYYCEMTDGQKKFYNQVRDQYRAEIMNLIDTTGLQDARFKVLQGLTKLRQLACHPRLIDENSRRDSGKFEAFFESLREIVAGGHKVLVFSQFVRMLKLIADELKKERIKFEVLTGATRDRQTCVKNFQEDPKTKVFLISLKAGGLGLNLTAADYVMIYDPWWNPAAERQAADRAHRIGQTKNVFVYKMITRDTVEEKILELQKRKENLVSQLITTDAGIFKHLTAEDIRGLFS